MSTNADLPYCGAPPVPGELWQNWNLDPVLIAVLLAGLGLYLWASVRGTDSLRIAAQRRLCFSLGWLITAAALVSPLCSLSVALFSARVGQHMLLTLVAAPLLVLGRPDTVLLTVWPGLGRVWVSCARFWPAGRLETAALLFAAFMWLWHMPAPYEATLNSDAVYWVMHLTLFFSALALWHALLDDGANAGLRGVIAALATAMQMGLLGALIALSSRPLYESHTATTWPWGLMPIEDQQLGGLIMWVPGGAVFLIAAMVVLASLLRRLEERTAIS